MKRHVKVITKNTKQLLGGFEGGFVTSVWSYNSLKDCGSGTVKSSGDVNGSRLKVLGVRGEGCNI